MKWIDISEEKPGSQHGINYVARGVGPWEEVRVCRVSLAADARWTIYLLSAGRWTQAPIEVDSKSKAMAVVEEAAGGVRTMMLVTAADKMEEAARKSRSLAFDIALNAVSGVT
jgi:hypothetical protein